MDLTQEVSKETAVTATVQELQTHLANGVSPITVQGGHGSGKSYAVSKAVESFTSLIWINCTGVKTAEGLLARLSAATGAVSNVVEDVFKRLENNSSVIVLDQMTEYVQADRLDATNLLKFLCRVPNLRLIIVSLDVPSYLTETVVTVMGMNASEAEECINRPMARSAIQSLCGLPRALRIVASLKELDANALFYAVRGDIAKLPIEMPESEKINVVCAMQAAKLLFDSNTALAELHALIANSQTGIPIWLLDLMCINSVVSLNVQMMLRYGLLERGLMSFTTCLSNPISRPKVGLTEVFELAQELTAIRCEEELSKLLGSDQSDVSLAWLQDAFWYVSVVKCADSSESGQYLKRVVTRLLSLCGCPREADALSVYLQTQGEYSSVEEVAWQTLHLVESAIRKSLFRTTEPLVAIFNNLKLSDEVRIHSGIILANALLGQNKPELSRLQIDNVLEIPSIDLRGRAICLWIQAKAIRLRDGLACPIDPFVKSRQAARDAGYTSLECANSVAIAKILVASGDLTGGIHVLMSSFEQVRDSKNDTTKAILLRRVAHLLSCSSEYESATAVAFASYQYATAAGSVECALTACHMMVCYAVESGAVPVAVSAAYLSQRLTVEIGSFSSVISTQLGAIQAALSASGIDLKLNLTTDRAISVIKDQIEIWRIHMSIESTLGLAA